jgi:hypothetical protein
VSDDWKRLGGVVRGITDRLESDLIARTPIPEADADLFHRLLLELYGAPTPSAARRTTDQEEENAPESRPAPIRSGGAGS